MRIQSTYSHLNEFSPKPEKTTHNRSHTRAQKREDSVELKSSATAMPILTTALMGSGLGVISGVTLEVTGLAGSQAPLVGLVAGGIAGLGIGLALTQGLLDNRCGRIQSRRAPEI